MHSPASTLSVMLASVAEFSSKSYIQKALSNPSTPGSVLSFFFGIDYEDSDNGKYKQIMREDCDQVYELSQPFWWSPTTEYDKMTKSFQTVIRDAGNQRLSSSESAGSHLLWNGNIDGIMAQILLCDQLARNCFRGEDEAFAYDHVAEDLSLKLIQDYFHKTDVENSLSTTKSSSTTLPGEYYIPYLQFISLPLMHSENLASHQQGIQLLDSAIGKLEDDANSSSSNVPKQALVGTKDFFIEHTAIIDKFGRYPHRNKKLGRESTLAEQQWLNDVDNLPGWAKSQM